MTLDFSDMAFDVPEPPVPDLPKPEPINLIEPPEPPAPPKAPDFSAQAAVPPPPESPPSAPPPTPIRAPKQPAAPDFSAQPQAEPPSPPATPRYRASVALGVSDDDWDSYRRALKTKEAAAPDQMGGYNKAYAGSYQLGRAEIRNVARMLGEKPPTRQEFLADPDMQERYLQELTTSNHDYLTRMSPAYTAMPPTEKLKTLAYAHNQGGPNTSRYLATGQVGHDAFGTPGTDYSDAVGRELGQAANVDKDINTPAQGVDVDLNAPHLGAVGKPDLVQELFNLPPDERKAYLDQKIHEELGLPIDLNEPAGTLGVGSHPEEPDTGPGMPQRDPRAVIPPDLKQNYERNKAYAKAGASGFNTDLGDKEPAFRAWAAENKVPFDSDARATDYDMRGFWKGLQAKDPKAVATVDPNDGRLHYPDYWKTPYHQSFSAESQWAKEDAPHWNDQDQLVDKQGRVVFDDKARVPGGPDFSAAANEAGPPPPDFSSKATPVAPEETGFWDQASKAMSKAGDYVSQLLGEKGKPQQNRSYEFLKDLFAGPYGFSDDQIAKLRKLGILPENEDMSYTGRERAIRAAGGVPDAAMRVMAAPFVFATSEIVDAYQKATGASDTEANQLERDLNLELTRQMGVAHGVAPEPKPSTALGERVVTMADGRDPYAVLGVPADASLSDIKAAFRQRAMALHPDTGGTGSGKDFADLTEAYRSARDKFAAGGAKLPVAAAPESRSCLPLPRSQRWPRLKPRL